MQRFPSFLAENNETQWGTWACGYPGGVTRDAIYTKPFEQALKVAARQLLATKQYDEAVLRDGVQIDDEDRLGMPPGGMQSLSMYHLSIVKGGAPWPEDEAKA